MSSPNLLSAVAVEQVTGGLQLPLILDVAWRHDSCVLAAAPTWGAREIAVLADQRRRAGHAFTSDALVEWHRHNLPALTERIGSRLRKHGEDGHQPWPAKGRYTRNTAEISRRTRQDSFAAEIGGPEPTRGEG